MREFFIDYIALFNEYIVKELNFNRINVLNRFWDEGESCKSVTFPYFYAKFICLSSLSSKPFIKKKGISYGHHP